MDDGDPVKEKDVIAPYMLDQEDSITRSWWYKIPDNKYTGKKPFDVFAIYDCLRPEAIEFKIHKTLSPWPFNKVIDYQVDSLNKFRRAGGSARIVVCIRLLLSEADRKKFDYPKRRVSIDAEFTIDEFNQYKATHSHIDIRKLLKTGVNGNVSGERLFGCCVSRSNAAVAESV